MWLCDIKCWLTWACDYNKFILWVCNNPQWEIWLRTKQFFEYTIGSKLYSSSFSQYISHSVSLFSFFLWIWKIPLFLQASFLLYFTFLSFSILILYCICLFFFSSMNSSMSYPCSTGQFSILLGSSFLIIMINGDFWGFLSYPD